MGPHRQWPWPVGRLATCPIAQLGDYPVGLDAVVGLIDLIVQLFAWLASSWPGWPFTRSPVAPLAVGQLSVLDTYFPPKLPR